MNKIGICKKLDPLGRVLIPKEMRELFRFKDHVELVLTTEEGILIRNPPQESQKTPKQ